MAFAVTEVATLHVFVSGAPRTKKNHGRLVTNGNRPRLFPAKAWTDWCKSAEIRVENRVIHVVTGTTLVVSMQGRSTRTWIPLERMVNCAATFYRDRTTGDAVGYYQGLADLLEKRGILANDRQIVSWDGSRLLKDADCPRTEILLTEAP